MRECRGELETGGERGKRYRRRELTERGKRGEGERKKRINGWSPGVGHHAGSRKNLDETSWTARRDIRKKKLGSAIEPGNTLKKPHNPNLDQSGGRVWVRVEKVEDTIIKVRQWGGQKKRTGLKEESSGPHRVEGPCAEGPPRRRSLGGQAARQKPDHRKGEKNPGVGWGVVYDAKGRKRNPEDSERRKTKTGERKTKEGFKFDTQGVLPTAVKSEKKSRVGRSAEK